MKKTILLLALLGIVALSAFAQDSVTFQVNMKVQANLKKFDPAKDSVFLRGNWFAGPGNWWETNSMKLADADGDSIYTGKFDVGVVPKRLGQFKYIVRGVTFGGDHWEIDNADGSHKDRTDTIPSVPWTLPVVWFDGDSTSVYFDNNITFSVNMREQIKSNAFKIANDSVVVRGDFNGWGGKTHLLLDADGDSIYTGTYNITSTKKIIFKFVKITATGDGWESSPDRVVDNLTGPTTLLPVYFFNNYDPAHGQVTFQVNLKVQTKLKKFDPAKDSVFLRGNFYAGPGNWWETNSMKLADPNGDTIYTGTFDVGAVPKRLGQFKYIVRGASYPGDHWEIDNADGSHKDRTDTIPKTPFTLPMVWFDGDSTSVYFDNDITFSVNMKEQMKSNSFKIATDSVVVRGDFNGWGGKTHLLLDADGDSVYTGTYNVPSSRKIIFKFVKITPTGDGWESSPDRVVDNLTGPTTLLPVYFFNNYDPMHGLVTFQVNLKVQTKLKKFDPAKDSVFLRGNFYAGPGNWWETNSMKLADPNGDTIYTGTFDVGAVPKRLGQYKYIVRGVTFAGDHWEVDNADGSHKDRTDTIPKTPFTLPAVWFDGDSTSVYFDNVVTFRVDLRPQIIKNKFKKATDSLIVRGDFNGWGGKKNVLLDADGDSIYTGSWNISSAKKIIFKFVRIPADAWESTPDRVVDNLTGPTTLLPIMFFNGDSLLTSVNDRSMMVLKYELDQNYPNPFNPNTTINYSIEHAGLVKLRVFNILGQEVVTLVNEVQDAGQYQTQFNADKLSSGIYFYKLESGSFSSLKKMMLIK
ncbi:MAG: T9SS type A sorting domain-containing protein [Bacteroidota bacterium]